MTDLCQLMFCLAWVQKESILSSSGNVLGRPAGTAIRICDQWRFLCLFEAAVCHALNVLFQLISLDVCAHVASQGYAVTTALTKAQEKIRGLQVFWQGLPVGDYRSTSSIGFFGGWR